MMSPQYFVERDVRFEPLTGEWKDCGYCGLSKWFEHYYKSKEPFYCSQEHRELHRREAQMDRLIAAIEGLSFELHMKRMNG